MGCLTGVAPRLPNRNHTLMTAADADLTLSLLRNVTGQLKRSPSCCHPHSAPSSSPPRQPPRPPMPQHFTPLLTALAEAHLTPSFRQSRTTTTGGRPAGWFTAC